MLVMSLYGDGLMNEEDLNLNFRHEVMGEKLIIAIAQDYESSEVLMVAYMNKEALMKTFKTKLAHYWSTSRNKLWLKGESSGHIQEVLEILTDCDEDAVLLKVKQTGGACHKGYHSCFFRKIHGENGNLKVFKDKVFDPENLWR